MTLPTLSPRDLADSRALFDRQPHEAAIDLDLYPITEAELAQLMARQLGLSEHRPCPGRNPVPQNAATEESS